MANRVDPDQTAPIGAVCSGSMLFASVLNLSVLLGNYLQQTTFSDDFFSWRFRGQTFFMLNSSKIKFILLMLKCHKLMALKHL